MGIQELKRGGFRRLCQGAAHWGVWSPDGKFVAHNWVRTPGGDLAAEAFGRENGAKTSLFLTPADGSGAPVQLTKSDLPQMPYSFSPDGKILAIQQGKESEESSEIWMVEIESRKAYPFVPGGHGSVHPAFSPNGHWLAYASKESGRWEVMVRPFPGPGAAMQVSTEGGWEPLWTSDGKRIVYRTVDGRTIMASMFQTGTPPNLESPQVLVQGAFWPGLPYGRMYDVAADGKRFFVIGLPKPIPRADQYVVVLNWVEELKRLVP